MTRTFWAFRSRDHFLLLRRGGFLRAARRADDGPLEMLTRKIARVNTVCVGSRALMDTGRPAFVGCSVLE